MEHIKGMTLCEFRKHAASGDEILKAENIVREKMQRLHDLGVHHGDLHAGNILVVVGKRRSVADVFILDYGFASNLAEKKAEDFADLQKLVDGRMPRISSYDVAIELVRTGVVRVT
jgi:predicted unusual protein kinase regulating ubiquinone biosynthesis (AarF/ABC1/UbiB family)